MATAEPGKLYWIASETDAFVPARATAEGKFQTLDGEEHPGTVEFSVANEEVLDPSLDDLVNISDLNEKALLHTLRVRFKKDEIYTFVSSILIAINPFKMLPLYTSEQMELYRGGQTKKPHVFATARAAYTGMTSSRKNQSIVISGESGAGKSETTKLILQFIADLSSRQSGTYTGGGGSTQLEQQILQANPVMEAFGNAKTSRNNNSSRFGKLISVEFDATGGISGGSVIPYLLEKSRVMGHAEGERNYHIFYQLIAGCHVDPALSAAVRVAESMDLEFRCQDACKIPGASDEKSFNEMRRAMKTLDFSDEEAANVFKCVGAVMHGMLVTFEGEARSDGEEAARASDTPALGNMAEMLGVDTAELTKVLTSKNIGTRSIILVSYSVVQACDVRDALCKALYAKLFDWIIAKINACLATGKAHTNIIGVLDIFGFESFEKNSFEQLCINYCNEKLQFHFNEHIFRIEQELYTGEAIDVPKTDFKDNRPTLDLLELKGTGVFAMLDEEINVPRGNDEGFCNKATKRHGQHANFCVPTPKMKKASPLLFGIHHYAATVYYDASGFLEKNKDKLHDDVVSALKQSSDPLVSSFFPSQEEPDAGPSRGRSKSAKQATTAAQFKKQLSELMKLLNSTMPHFVRCLKPNSKKIGNVYDAEMMLAQLRYSGLLEVCRIRKLGFPIRQGFAEFLQRYAPLAPGAATLPDLVAALQANGLLEAGQWAQGKSKVFLRSDQSSALDVAREKLLVTYCQKMQKTIRTYLAQHRYRYYLKILNSIRKACADRNCADLNEWLDMSAELPSKGSHLPAVKEGRLLRARLGEEVRVTTLLQESVDARDESQLSAAITSAESLAPPLSGALLDEAKKLLLTLKEQRSVTLALTAAMAKRDVDELTSLLEKCKTLGLDSEEVRQAAALRVRLGEELSARRSLEAAIKSRSMDELSTAVAKFSELGLTDADAVALLQSATRLCSVVGEEIKAQEAVQTAITRRDLPQLASALAKAKTLGLPSTIAVISEGLELEKTLQEEKLAAALDEKADAVNALKSAQQCRDVDALKAAIDRATSLDMASDPEVASAQAMVRDLDLDAQALAALTQAVEGRDLAVLRPALETALERKIDGPVVNQARSMLNRDESIKELDAKLAKAMASDDLASLNSALDSVIQLGVTGEQYDAAATKRDELAARDRCARTLASSIAALGPKAKSETGIAPADIDTIAAAIVESKLPSDSAEVLKALALQDVMKRQLGVQAELGAALEAGDDRARMKSAVAAAEEMELNPALFAPHKQVLKDLGEKFRAVQEAADVDDVVDTEALDTLRAERLDRQATAKSVKFGFQNFPDMRTPDDFARGILLGKKKIKDGMLRWQNTVMPRSLLDISSEFNTVAKQIHKDILGYSGDKQMSYPATLAKDVLQKGLEKHVLRDEVFCQIMKQLTGNPSFDSIAKLWQLLCMSVSTFPPSTELEPYLLNFLLTNGQKGAVKNYALYALKSLEAILDSGASGFVPSVAEIAAYKDRPPLLATIELVDGNILTEELPITPDLTVGRVCNICTTFLELTDPRMDCMGIFVVDLGVAEGSRDPDAEKGFNGLTRHPCPLRAEDFMGDVMVQKTRQRRNFKFVFKRKIFLDGQDNPSADEVYSRLQYLHCEDEVIYRGNLPFDEAQALNLSALSFAVANEGATSADEYEDEDLLEFISPALRAAGDSSALAHKLRGACGNVEEGKATSEHQDKFISVAAAHPLYGAHFFEVLVLHQEPLVCEKLQKEKILLAFNKGGMAILDQQDRSTLYQCGFADLFRWGGSSSVFSIFVWDSASSTQFELKVATSQAQEIAGIILDYITALMKG